MSRSQAADAVERLRQDLLGESKLDPGLLIRMNDQLQDLAQRQKRVERNPMVVLGRNFHWAGAAIIIVFTALGGPVLGSWVKATLHIH